MKTRTLLMAATLLSTVLAFNSESFARGGNGGGNGQGSMNRTQSQTQTSTTAQKQYKYKKQTQTEAQTQVRPEGSQRRDGTFLQTGTTANGSTTRPANGKGAMDGSGLNATPTTTP